jgi:hypothetical protein
MTHHLSGKRMRRLLSQSPPKDAAHCKIACRINRLFLDYGSAHRSKTALNNWRPESDIFLKRSLLPTKSPNKKYRILFEGNKIVPMS